MHICPVIWPALLSGHALQARMPDDAKMCPGLRNVILDITTGVLGPSNVMDINVLIPQASTKLIQATASGASKFMSHQKQVLLQQTPEGRQPHCHNKPDHMSISQHGVHASICAALLPSLALWFAAQAQVTWISMQRRMEPLNLAAAAALQAPTRINVTSLPGAATLQAGVTSGYFPYWQAGLDGTGQV
jgi:hypothetical protein